MVKIKHNLNTTIDMKIYTSFRKKCDEDGNSMNEVLEVLMNDYVENDYQIEVEKKISLKKN
ncbi:hypothetical protein ACFP7A_01100 [Sporolactobacillus kofuensis]|uniref:Uncharacterized protein n=1 Tax=Sporolactobacillus kofuensis TaxID=269672 RepID=A0ABW1WAB4_9BACL|nr:hypothetical protein [Sporolactobacillus kofuensis]MCO7176995.1 hypothetical protein [Sporolactobacillus kofuensis]